MAMKARSTSTSAWFNRALTSTALHLKDPKRRYDTEYDLGTTDDVRPVLTATEAWVSVCSRGNYHPGERRR